MEIEMLIILLPTNLKQCHFYWTLGKRVQIRKAPQAVSDAVPERKRSTPMNPANTIRKTHGSSSVSQRPYRDRVIHLLALKAYKKPELLARLQKDGVNQKDKNSLGAILQQVRTTRESSLLLPSYWGVHLRRACCYHYY